MSSPAFDKILEEAIVNSTDPIYGRLLATGMVQTYMDFVKSELRQGVDRGDLMFNSCYVTAMMLAGGLKFANPQDFDEALGMMADCMADIMKAMGEKKSCQS